MDLKNIAHMLIDFVGGAALLSIGGPTVASLLSVGGIVSAVTSVTSAVVSGVSILLTAGGFYGLGLGVQSAIKNVSPYLPK